MTPRLTKRERRSSRNQDLLERMSVGRVGATGRKVEQLGHAPEPFTANAPRGDLTFIAHTGRAVVGSQSTNPVETPWPSEEAHAT